MKKKCEPKTRKFLPTPIFLIFLLFISFSLFAQSEETKIAYINQSRLRSEFQDYTKSNKELKEQYQKALKSYEKDIQKSDSTYQGQIKVDSLASSDLSFVTKYENERKALKGEHEKQIDEILQQRKLDMDAYEQKIIKTIEEVILQGKFVEVRNRYKNTNVSDGQDITDQILAILNN